MTGKWTLMAVMAVLVVIGVLIVAQLSSAQDVTPTTTPERSVVAAVACESVTDYEPDPFEPQRVRSNTVRVRRVAVVYSDGSVETVPVTR